MMYLFVVANAVFTDGPSSLPLVDTSCLISRESATQQ